MPVRAIVKNPYDPNSVRFTITKKSVTDLYDELKHVRNAIHRILGSLDFASDAQVQARHIEMLAATHRLLHAQSKRHVVPNPGQMSLF